MLELKILTKRKFCGLISKFLETKKLWKFYLENASKWVLHKCHYVFIKALQIHVSGFIPQFKSKWIQSDSYQKCEKGKGTFQKEYAYFLFNENTFHFMYMYLTKITRDFKLFCYFWNLKKIAGENFINTKIEQFHAKRT